MDRVNWGGTKRGFAVTTREETVRRFNEISKRHNEVRRFSGSETIRTDVQHMRRRYTETNHKMPSRILLDSVAESRLTAMMVCYLISQNEDKKVEEILGFGIRQLGLKMFGMEIFFDCLDFCLD